MSETQPRAVVEPIAYAPTRSWPPSAWVGEVTDDEHLRALAVGASFAQNWGAPHDALSFAATNGGEDPEKRVGAIDALHDWWGITDRDGALDCAHRLHIGMHAPDYQFIHPLSARASAVSEELDFMAQRDKDRTFIAQAFMLAGQSPDSALHTYEQWTQALRMFTPSLPAPIPMRLAGWDLVRSAFVIRASFTAGYIDADQAWGLLHEGLRIARREYANWRQLADGYLLGYMIWQAQSNLASWSKNADQRAVLMTRMLIDPTSPWRRVALRPDGRVVGSRVT